jgi:prolyl 4-hydroxylase
MSSMPAEWKQWVIKALLSGTSANNIAAILDENGFAPALIQSVLGGNLPADYVFSQPIRFYDGLANSAITQNPDAKPLGNANDIQLYSINNFLSQQECDEIVSLTKNKLKPSTIAGAKSADNIRTSSTCELAFLNNPLVEAVDNRIVNALKLGVGEREVIQAQHYNEGEYYKPHYDFFPPGSEQYKTHCASRGQRTWTCMIYLNNVDAGGDTRFTKLGLAVSPEKGKALFWNNLQPNGEPNTNTIHFAEPVQKGHKTVITKWFRDKNS